MDKNPVSKKRLSKEDFMEYTGVVIIMGILALIGNYFGYGKQIAESLPGITILALIAIAGITLHRLIQLKIPMIIYISLISILLTSPICPVGEQIFAYTSKINSMCLVTPLLAFIGMNLGKEHKLFMQQGIKGILVTILVILGTVLGSATIAQIVLSAQGMI